MSYQLQVYDTRIKALEHLCQADPGDFMSQFELDELKIKRDKLERRIKLGIRLVKPTVYVVEGGVLKKR